MEHGNLLHPKIITVAVCGFLSLIWMVNFQLELPADAGRGSSGVHQAFWGVAACLSPFLLWRIENFLDSVKFGSGRKKKKKKAVICISDHNQIWVYGSQIQSFLLGRGDVESEGKGPRGCRKGLTAGEEGAIQ